MVNEFLAYVGSVLIAWSILTIITFICIIWCFSYKITLKQAFMWTISLLIIPSLATLAWSDHAKKIIFPVVVCLLAVHTFLICLRNYFSNSTHINALRFYTTIVLLYTIFFGGCWWIIHFKNPVLIAGSMITCNYLIFVAVIGVFILTLLR